MENPQFSAKQYIDAPTLNSAFASVSGNVDLALAALNWNGGLVHPENLMLTPAGLTVNITAPLTFGAIFPIGSGAAIFAQGHGSLGGQDTQSYSASFSGLVPASGTITAYLAASAASISQAATQIVGPPPGHPDYNPNFSPYTAYTLLTDTLSIFATSGVPDGVTTFELARTSLSVGATGVVLVLAYQTRVQPPPVTQMITVSGNTTVSLANAGRRHQATSPITITLPDVSSSNGLVFPFSSATSGITTVQAAGSDLIYGSSNASVSGIVSITIPTGGAVTLEADQGRWQIIASTTIASTSPVVGSVRNLTGSASGGSKTASWTVNEIIVETALGGQAYKGTSLTLNFNGSGVGVNGMDTGSIPASGDLFVYAIYNPSSNVWGTLGTISGAGSQIYAGSNMPAGFIASALIWSGKTNGSNINTFSQLDRDIAIAQAVSPLLTSTTITSISISSIVPVNARTISGWIDTGTGSANSIELYCDANANGKTPFSGTAGAQNGTFTNLFCAGQQFWYAIPGGGITGSMGISRYSV